MPVFSKPSPLLFSSQALNLYAYTENNPIDRIDPLGLWYIDVGVAIGLWGGAVGGFLIGPEGIYSYAGGGVVSPPGGVSVTWSPQDPTAGWSVGGQAGYWFGGQYGYGFGKNGKGAGKYWELGFVTPGASITGYYVDEPWKWPWKRPKPKKCP